VGIQIFTSFFFLRQSCHHRSTIYINPASELITNQQEGSLKDSFDRYKAFNKRKHFTNYAYHRVKLPLRYYQRKEELKRIEYKRRSSIKISSNKTRESPTIPLLINVTNKRVHKDQNEVGSNSREIKIAINNANDWTSSITKQGHNNSSTFTPFHKLIFKQRGFKSIKYHSRIKGAANADFINKNLLYPFNKNNGTFSIAEVNMSRKNVSRNRKFVVEENSASIRTKQISPVKQLEMSSWKYCVYSIDNIKKNSEEVLTTEALQARAKRKVLHYRTIKKPFKVNLLKIVQGNSHKALFKKRVKDFPSKLINSDNKQPKVIVNIRKNLDISHEVKAESISDESITLNYDDSILKPILTCK